MEVNLMYYIVRYVFVEGLEGTGGLTAYSALPWLLRAVSVYVGH